MVLHNVDYAASQSKLAGNAVEFQGTSNSYGRTANDSRLFNSLGSKSMTVMTWVYWYSAADATAFFEFVGDGRGFIFWFLNGGIWYDLSKYFDTSASGNLRNVTYSLTPPLNRWHHFAFVYNGDNGVIKSYVNYTLVSAISIGSISNYNPW
jgi:hypothetical protein